MEFIKEIFLMAKGKDMELFNGTMVKNLKETGKME